MTRAKIKKILQRQIKIDYDEGYRGYVLNGIDDAADQVMALFKSVLREHWLTGIVCDHEAKTDRATCSCSEWRCDSKPSVGAAVDAWIDHALSAHSSTVRESP